MSQISSSVKPTTIAFPVRLSDFLRTGRQLDRVVSMLYAKRAGVTIVNCDLVARIASPESSRRSLRAIRRSMCNSVGARDPTIISRSTALSPPIVSMTALRYVRMLEIRQVDAPSARLHVGDKSESFTSLENLRPHVFVEIIEIAELKRLMIDTIIQVAQAQNCVASRVAQDYVRRSARFGALPKETERRRVMDPENADPRVHAQRRGTAWTPTRDQSGFRHSDWFCERYLPDNFQSILPRVEVIRCRERAFRARLGWRAHNP